MDILALDPEDHQVILHIDKTNPLNKTKLKLNSHKLSSIFVRYHYENIYLKLKEELIL